MPSPTQEQIAVIESRGKTIVSASAGSGKTFVMIQKLCDFVQNGGDLDNLLAITYTQKAAAQMKEKLRSALIERLKTCGESERAHIKVQLNKIPYADVSTVHSFCSRLIRTYFYAADTEASFDIIGADAGIVRALTYRAVDELFEELYQTDDEEFLHLLACYRKKRSDGNLKQMLVACYGSVRNMPNYRQALQNYTNVYCKQGFDEICSQILAYVLPVCKELFAQTEEFEKGFGVQDIKNGAVYKIIFDEIYQSLQTAIERKDIFEPLPKLKSTAKPRDKEDDKAEGERFKEFFADLQKGYDKICDAYLPREEEFARFMQSGKTATAFCNLLLKFDERFTAVKREEGKLDYCDLEHYALKILENEDILRQIHAKYTQVFVDEYQDINPVQDCIIDALCSQNSFFVGDIKQAIYAFQGSKSQFFADKFASYSKGAGNALQLSSNFRSSAPVVNFVNALFAQVMHLGVCDIDYAATENMVYGAPYRDESALEEKVCSAEVVLFNREKAQKTKPNSIYSVKQNAGKKAEYSALALGVLTLVEEQLKQKVFDLKENCYRPTQTGDICILVRKRNHADTAEIERCLRDAGYSVSGASEESVLQTPEVKLLLDMLSFIDNAEQDVPCAAFMLSPLGGFTEEELAKIRIKHAGEKNAPFRACVAYYGQTYRDDLAIKIQAFGKRYEHYRDLSEMLGAGALIDKICEDTGWEASYAARGGERLKNIRAVAAYAYASGGDTPLCDFLKKMEAGANVAVPDGADADSVKIMTMHASKGLEFPVVIVADIAATFRGQEEYNMPFDESFGFAPRWFDTQNMIIGSTMLRRLYAMKTQREELKNELNLFYVACTRAMCRLYVMASELPAYNQVEAMYAGSYNKLANFSVLPIRLLDCPQHIAQIAQNQQLISAPDKEAMQLIKQNFMRPYAHAQSVDLPVKSSASRLLKELSGESAYAVNQLFHEDEIDAKTQANEYSLAGSSERGLAYHRYLQLCDFSKKTQAEIEEQLQRFAQDGLMSEREIALVQAEKLQRILQMSVFENLDGTQMLREQSFLCRLPAHEFLPTEATDKVLVQGAIDLLVLGNGNARVVDYKFSGKTDEALLATYAPQLKLYKRAVSVICNLSEDKIQTTIVNICRLTEIPVL